MIEQGLKSNQTPVNVEMARIYRLYGTFLERVSFVMEIDYEETKKNYLRNYSSQFIGQYCRRGNKVKDILPAIEELRFLLTGHDLFKFLQIT